MELCNTAFWDSLAIETYKEIIKKNPNSGLAHFHLGLAYMRQQRDNKAVRCFQKALKCDKSLMTAYYHLSAAYKRMGKQTDATKSLERFMDSTEAVQENR